MIELSATQLDKVRCLLSRHVPDREVRAFGSRINGRAWRFSDLDLVIMGPAPPADLVMANLKADFEDSDLPFRVDLMPAQDLPETWRGDFMAESERVFPHVADETE